MLLHLPGSKDKALREGTELREDREETKIKEALSRALNRRTTC